MGQVLYKHNLLCNSHGVSCLLMWHSRILNKIISMKLGVLSMSTVYVHWPACRDFAAGWYKAQIVQLL